MKNVNKTSGAVAPSSIPLPNNQLIVRWKEGELLYGCPMENKHGFLEEE
ncbi:MAG: hypothetical protein V4733_12005 [Verrucomicrobiota bacterium]